MIPPTISGHIPLGWSRSWKPLALALKAIRLVVVILGRAFREAKLARWERLGGNIQEKISHSLDYVI